MKNPASYLSAKISIVTDAKGIMGKYESAPRLKPKMWQTLAKNIELRIGCFCTCLAIKSTSLEILS